MSTGVGAPMPSKHRALVVAADDELRTSWSDALGRIAIDVVLEADAEQALCIAAELRPDALVIDLEIPRCDPLQLVVCARAHHRTQGAVVIALAETVTDDIIALARAAGCDAVLSRNAKPRAIASVIARLAERGPRRAPERRLVPRPQPALGAMT